MSEGPKCSGVGLVPWEKKAFLRSKGACRLGGTLLYKEVLCFDISEKPQLAHWGAGQQQELACGCTAEVSLSCQRASGYADRGPLFLVHCVECRVFGAMGRVGSSHSFHRVQLNENRKIKNQKRRKKVPTMLMCQVGN